MTKLTLGSKEFQIKYGYEATIKSGIIKRLANIPTKGETLDRVDYILEFLPEMLLVGLQKYHKDEFGYDYTTGDGKEDKLSVVYSMLDDYFDNEDSDFMDILNLLQNELMENGFLAKMFRDEKAKAEQSEKKNQQKTNTTEQMSIEN